MNRRLSPLAAALAAALLAACGGGGDAQLSDLQEAEAPADTGAHTRNGLYLSRRQADTLEQAMPGRLVRVDVECCDAQAIEFAVASAEIEQVTLSLPRSAPILVSGANLRHAAIAADRLAEGGATRVFLVTD